MKKPVSVTETDDAKERKFSEDGKVSRKNLYICRETLKSEDMRIHFFFASSETIQDSLAFNVEWDLHCLPRVGEGIGSSIIMSKVTPKMFREMLTDTAAKEWEKQVKENPIGCTREEYESIVMCDWLMDMNMQVASILWCYKDGEHYASMMLMEEEECKEAERKRNCPFRP